MTVPEKVAYLKGLMEGLDVTADSKEGKLFNCIADILCDIADEIESLNIDLAELNDCVDEIDEDLGSLETDFYELDDEDSDDECDCDCDCDDCCECCGDEFYEVTCGACGEKINVTEDVLLEGGMDCPKCGTELEFDVEYEEDEEEN